MDAMLIGLVMAVAASILFMVAMFKDIAGLERMNSLYKDGVTLEIQTNDELEEKLRAAHLSNVKEISRSKDGKVIATGEKGNHLLFCEGAVVKIELPEYRQGFARLYRTIRAMQLPGKIKTSIEANRIMDAFVRSVDPTRSIDEGRYATVKPHGGMMAISMCMVFVAIILIITGVMGI